MLLTSHEHHWEAAIDQQGYRIHAWDGDLVWETFPMPEPAAGEVLIEVEACGVGLTVLNYCVGNLDDDPRQLPRVPGHELVGRVVGVGAGSDDALLGERVTAYFYLFCGNCQRCLSGQEPCCERLAGWIGVHRDGGYARYAVLPSRNVIRLPVGVDAVTGTVIPDAVATPVHVCGSRAGLRPEDRVVVIGAGGGVGMHMVQVARTYCGRVAGVDVTTEKLEALEQLGILAIDGNAIGTINPDRLWSAGRPSAVIDLVGNDDTLSWSLNALDTGGRLVVVTTFRNRAVVAPTRQLVFREATVMGSRYASRADVARAAELVGSGEIEAIVGVTTGPKGIPELHEQLRNGKLVGRGAVSWARSADESDLRHSSV